MKIMTPIHHRNRGFTLIELMITIAIAAILLMIAVPSFRDYQANQQVRSTAQNLAVALNMARSEAIKRSAGVTVEPVTAGDWASGWSVVFGTSTLQSFGAVQGVTINASETTSPIYNRDGRVNLGAGVDDFTFTIAPVGAASVSSHCVKIEVSGKATNKVGGCS
jgi:type IV fimbrial biogenesis protein FimT